MIGGHTNGEGRHCLAIYTSLNVDEVPYLQRSITAVLHDLMTGDRTTRGRDGAAYLLVLLEDILPEEDFSNEECVPTTAKSS